MNTTKTENITWAKTLLDGYRDHFRDGGLLLFSIDYGTGLTDYLRAYAVHADKTTGDQCTGNLTWAIGTALGYSLRDRGGRWTLALSGGGYSKSLDVSIALARYYGLDTYGIKSAII